MLTLTSHCHSVEPDWGKFSWNSPLLFWVFCSKKRATPWLFGCVGFQNEKLPPRRGKPLGSFRFHFSDGFITIYQQISGFDASEPTVFTALTPTRNNTGNAFWNAKKKSPPQKLPATCCINFDPFLNMGSPFHEPKNPRCFFYMDFFTNKVNL